MKRITIILPICIIIMLSGCNDFLDIKPKGEKIPKTVTDFETLLNYESVQKVSDTYPAAFEALKALPFGCKGRSGNAVCMSDRICA